MDTPNIPANSGPIQSVHNVLQGADQLTAEDLNIVKEFLEGNYRNLVIYYRNSTLEARIQIDGENLY
jgi:hypothetical protein